MSPKLVLLVDDVLPDGFSETRIRKILLDNPLRGWPRLAAARTKETVA